MTLQDTKLNLVKLHSQLLGTNGHECHSVSDCNSNFADALLEEVAKRVEQEAIDSGGTQDDVDYAHNQGVTAAASAIRSGKGK